jgi:hypothetical protein
MCGATYQKQFVVWHLGWNWEKREGKLSFTWVSYTMVAFEVSYWQCAVIDFTNSETYSTSVDWVYVVVQRLRHLGAPHRAPRTRILRDSCIYYTSQYREKHSITNTIERGFHQIGMISVQRQTMMRRMSMRNKDNALQACNREPNKSIECVARACATNIKRFWDLVYAGIIYTLYIWGPGWRLTSVQDLW